MTRRMFRSKLHRATVTQADLHYEGSVTIDAELLEASDIAPYEEVHVWNVTRGTRFQTYAMRGEPGSKVICINGAAAHLAKRDDLVIIATFCEVSEERVADWQPKVVLLGEGNAIVAADHLETPGPDTPTASPDESNAS